MLIFMLSAAIAGTLAGVTLPDRVTINDSPVLLNGMGLREKFWIDVYVAGLYLSEPDNDPQRIIRSKTPKRVHSVFIYPSIPKEKMQDTLRENLANNPEINRSVQDRFEHCLVLLEDFTQGDEVIFDYHPNIGTSLIVKGKTKATIVGDDFMEAIFSIYLGDAPASKQLKAGLLGR